MFKRFLFFAVLSSNLVFAQKKPLNHSVYDSWQSLGAKSISNNGSWTSYQINVQEGDYNLYLKENNNTGRSLKIERGSGLYFSTDSKFAAAYIKPFFKDIKNTKSKKSDKSNQPKDSLIIIDLSNLKTTKYPNVKSFAFPKESSAIFAYILEKPSNSSQQEKGNKSDTTKTKSTESDLWVKNLINNTEKNYPHTSDFSFSKNGKQLAFYSKGNKKDKNNKPGVYLLNTDKWTLKTLVNKKGAFKNFIFDDESEHLAFIGETDSAKKEIKNYQIYYNSLSLDTAQILVDNETTGMPKNWSISANGKLNFSKDGSKLYFGIAPTPGPKSKEDNEMDNAKLDVWSYKDDYLQPEQLKNVDKELKKSYLSSIDVFSPDPKIVVLTDLQLPDANLINEGNSSFVLASTDYGKRIESQWNGRTLRDYYLVDIKTGKRTKILANLKGYATSSPNGQYLIYFNRDNGNWYTYQIATAKTTCLNENLNVKFFDEENDSPDQPNSYGVAGWTENDKNVLIYDKYDIWMLSPDGKGKAINLTLGYGRGNQLTFRVEKTDSDARFFKKNEKLWLSAFNNINKESGYYRKSINDFKVPELVVIDKAKFSGLTRAKDTELYLYEKGTALSSPDLYLTKDFKTSIKISNTNPQQAEYNWLTAELVNWKTPKGYASQGILYKPEDFDPNKKYPMILYFYEKLADGLYNYQAPAPTPSRLNISFFVSNGYLVFTPDISYEIGHPGKSAEEFINSGVEYLKKNAWVDGSKIGIQGQSWGGYQVTHLITATNMYAAAWAGAPVVNMTSAYGGIRWASGKNRQFQYEKQQSRIGASLWEKPELYIENSPLFNLPKVTTPVVIMANDGDGAVPWYQGIEMFTALRRLGKTAWMLNYNGEEHNLVQRQNRKDIQIREQQFFDYYLKGAKAPVWMVDGIPATQKGKTWGFELTDGKP